MTAPPSCDCENWRELHSVLDFDFLRKMFKLTAVLSLLLIGNAIWASGISCDSCGSECASACGTRHFRSCCFNYLRRKRDPDVESKAWPQPHRDNAKETRAPNLPLVVVENVPNFPESWLSKLVPEYRPRLRPIDDLENRFQYLYN